MLVHSKIGHTRARIHVLPDDCILHILECGILTRSDLKTLRLCCKHLQHIASRILFRSAVILRTAKSVTSASFLARSISTHAPGISNLLTMLTIYGGSTWGMLIMTTEQLWIVLTAASGVRTVVLASVHIADPPYAHAFVKRRTSVQRFSFLDVDFESTSTFIHAMTVVGIIGWLHLERITVSRGIQLGIGSPSADQLHCRTWVPAARRVSFYSLSWRLIGAFTSTFSPADERAKHIEELDLSFRYPCRAKSAFPLLRACSGLRTLRIYIYPPDATEQYNFSQFFSDLPQTSITTLEVFATTRRDTSPDVVLKLAWSCIGAIPPSATTITVGLSETCVQYLVKSESGLDDPAANWPHLVEALKSHPQKPSVQFCEWFYSPRTVLLMADPFATPDDTDIPEVYELQHALRPCNEILRSRLKDRLQPVMNVVCVRV